MPGMGGNQFFNTEGMDGIDKDDPFSNIGGLGSGLGGGFGHGRTPFRSQSFNVGSGTGARKVIFGYRLLSSYIFSSYV